MKNVFNKIVKNKEQKQKDDYEKLMDRVVPISKKIIKLIGDSDLTIGQITGKDGKVLPEIDVEYSKIGKKILELFLVSNLHYIEKDIVFQLVKQAYEQTEQKVLSSLDRSMDKASKTLWGKDFIDVKMSDIDDVLKRPVEIVEDIKEEEELKEVTK